MTAKKRKPDAFEQLSEQAQRRIEAAKTDEATIVEVNQSAEAEPEFTEEQLDALAEAYALLISLADEEIEAMQYWPKSVLDPIHFLQGRAKLTIDLEGQILHLLPAIDIGSQIDCVNHLLTEAVDLKRLCLSHNAFLAAETCDRVIEIAHLTKSPLEKSISMGGHDANTI